MPLFGSVLHRCSHEMCLKCVKPTYMMRTWYNIARVKSVEFRQGHRGSRSNVIQHSATRKRIGSESMWKSICFLNTVTPIIRCNKTKYPPPPVRKSWLLHWSWSGVFHCLYFYQSVHLTPYLNSRLCVCGKRGGEGGGWILPWLRFFDNFWTSSDSPLKRSLAIY